MTDIAETTEIPLTAPDVTEAVPAVDAPSAAPFGAPPAAGSGHGAGELVSVDICAWFGNRLVLEGVDLHMERSRVTALIGPSGCGKSTFLRTLNRMHEVVPGAQLAGAIYLDGSNIYDLEQRANEVRRHIGMVFQRPNPFPAMSIYDNVMAGLRFTRTKVKRPDDLVQESLERAGLWIEVKNRLRDLGGALSGGQQQRLCIARALAVKPKVLLMDEPCSALDPASTLRIEQTITEIADDVTVVIVTHNMQQAQRVSHSCAFFLAAENQPGRIIEAGPTTDLFENPQDPRTADYVHGRFG
jgi:phosphate transport system ATP-binding protein